MQGLSLSRAVHTAEQADLSVRLLEAEETLRAIRSGEADVLVAAGNGKVEVLARQGAERSYRLLIESMNEGALTMTAGAMILYCNPCFAKMVKCPPGRVMGSSFHRFLGTEDLATFRALLKRTNRAGAKVQILLVAGDNSKMAVQISFRPTARTGGGARTIGIVVTNLTEARRTEDLLRALTHRVVRAQEDERGRVAIELHDGAVQLLCALMFSSQTLLGHLSSGDGSARAEAEKIRDIARRAADEVDRVSKNLRPNVLDQLGLEAALSHAAREFTDRSGVGVKLTCVKLAGRLPPDHELTFYRIMQEALRNVEKHARARHVKVGLSQPGAFAQLVINDDGRGFDPDRRPTKREGRGGLGLLGMRERVSQAGGRFRFKSSRSSGTEIEVLFPIPS